MIEKLLGTSNSATGRGLKEGLIIPGHDLLGGFHTKKEEKPTSHENIRRDAPFPFKIKAWLISLLLSQQRVCIRENTQN